LLLNLCDGGQLRLATGVLYRGNGPAVLGSSDGLRVYEGEWQEEGGSIQATYHLAYAEIEFTGIELAKRTQFVEHLRLENGKMVFSLHSPPETKARTLRLTSSADAKQKVEDRFVECGKRESGEPSNKSLERTRER